MSVRSDSRSLYLLVIDRIKSDIEKGIFKHGSKLPSEHELAKKLGVSRVTLREALRILNDENIITRRHGIGTFVNAKPIFTSGIEELNSITQMIEKNNQKAGTILLKSEYINLSSSDNEIFNIKEGENILRIERIRTGDNEPLVYCIDKIPKLYLPEGFNFQREDSLFKTLEEEAKILISYAVTDISPIGYHAKISSLLHSPPESSLLILRQIHYDVMDRPILISVNYFRADKFRFQVLRRR